MILKNLDRLKPWKDRIAIHFIVQNEVSRYDSLRLWDYYYPELAATEKQIMEVETQLGHSLDNNYKDFLLCANGWKGFMQSINLFGTEDLMGSNLLHYAMEVLRNLDDAFPLVKSSGFAQEEMLPIAATLSDLDLHVITRATSRQPGVVIWFAGQEIERYPNFEEYFLSMTDYNRCEYERLKKDSEKNVL